VKFIASPNFMRVDGLRKITAVIVHYTGAMTTASTVSWFKQKVSGVSAHYVIGRDGEIIQMVKDNNEAWHAGKSKMPDTGQTGVNRFSIGIELVGTMDSGFLDVQMAAFYSLLEELVRKYEIPPHRVVGHADIAPGRKIDPDGHPVKQFNWVKTKEVAMRAYEEVTNG
jgi:N-acetylmuramoyl-L-alanine amidase